MWLFLSLASLALVVQSTVQVQSGGSSVKVSTENQSVDLHAEWLRERCQATVDAGTNQPQVSPHQYATPKVRSAELLEADAAAGAALRIEFEDGHVSSFPFKDLLKTATSEIKGDHVNALMQTHQAPVIKRTFWDNTFKPPTVEYSSIAGETEDQRWRRMEVTEILLKTGIVIIRGVPRHEGEVKKMAELLSSLRPTEWGKTFQVKYGMDAGEEGVTDDGKLDDRKDLAYTGKAIHMHTDNAYRYPTPDYQLLHAIEHCSCDMDAVNYTDTHNCAECSIFNTFTDGLAAADRIHANSPELFDALINTNVRFENDGGGGKSSIFHVSPILELNNDYKEDGCKGADCITAIRFSTKSGGYAPLKMKQAELDKFYEARRQFSDLVNEKEGGLQIALQLQPGDMVVFDNVRILHARSTVSKSDGKRHLQGCYMNRDGLLFNHELLRRSVGGSGTAEFRQLGNSTKADIEVMTNAYQGASTGEKLAERALGLLSQLDTPATKLGARVSLYEHSLQTATRALRAGEDEETVVVALLHDIGELMSPSSHGDVANAMLLPYISEKNQWVLKMHEIFQGYYYFHHQEGGNRDQRDDYKDHEYYGACKDFCEYYDQASFDETYNSLPLETFRPMVQRIFERKAYWWNPEHPKAGAVTGK